MNKKVCKTLEFDKIIKMLTEEADSPLGRESASHLRPLSNKSEIIALQAETTHALTRIFHHGALSFHGLTDIRPSLVPLSKGGTLGAGELLRIGALLDVTKRAIAFDQKDEETDFLSGRFAGLQSFPEINREIKRCILSEEEISDDASSELKRIRRQIKSTNDKVREQLNATVNASSDMLRDNIVTMRGGRYCLPVKKEYKSTFQGMIHDQSSTGSTFFIEPMAIVKLNNDLAELAMKEQDEIEKILASISSLCAPETEGLERNVILLAELDFIFAKAKLSKKMQGSEPDFTQNYISIKKGRHPLIPRDKVVPIDVTLGKDFRLLIITGPNTGGKTVSLKTVGLFTLMGQSGLHIPAFDGSCLRVYEEVYADIGDEQSIEQSLSTFSYDEYSNWDVFALSLPISRKELTLSKYIVFSIFPIFGALLAGILTTGISLFKGIMPNDELLISAIACLFTAELLVFILLPFIFKYGIERGRIMMMVLSFSIFGVIVLFGKLLNGLSIPDLSIKLETIFPLLPWIGIIVLLMIAYLSYQLSYRIIVKKEY